VWWYNGTHSTAAPCASGPSCSHTGKRPLCTVCPTASFPPSCVPPPGSIWPLAACFDLLRLSRRCCAPGRLATCACTSPTRLPTTSMLVAGSVPAAAGTPWLQCAHASKPIAYSHHSTAPWSSKHTVSTLTSRRMIQLHVLALKYWRSSVLHASTLGLASSPDQPVIARWQAPACPAHVAAVLRPAAQRTRPASSNRPHRHVPCSAQQ
jgi:hypothetical protein